MWPWSEELHPSGKGILSTMHILYNTAGHFYTILRNFKFESHTHVHGMIVFFEWRIYVHEGAFSRMCVQSIAPTVFGK